MGAGTLGDFLIDRLYEQIESIMIFKFVAPDTEVLHSLTEGNMPVSLLDVFAHLLELARDAPLAWTRFGWPVAEEWCSRFPKLHGVATQRMVDGGHGLDPSEHCGITLPLQLHFLRVPRWEDGEH